MRKIRENDYHCILSAYVLSLENKDTQRFTENIFYRLLLYSYFPIMWNIWSYRVFAKEEREEKNESNCSVQCTIECLSIKRKLSRTAEISATQESCRFIRFVWAMGYCSVFRADPGGSAPTSPGQPLLPNNFGFENYPTTTFARSMKTAPI